jgi:hypothetical protein
MRVNLSWLLGNNVCKKTVRLCVWLSWANRQLLLHLLLRVHPLAVLQHLWLTLPPRLQAVNRYPFRVRRYATL